MQPRRDPAATALHRLLAAAVLICVCGPSLGAGKTTFNPRVAAAWTYNDNVGFEAESDARDDTSVGVQVTLPVDHQLKQGALQFQYDVSSRTYSRFSSLDHLDHRLRFSYGRQTSRVASVSLNANYVLTQDQANPDILENSVDPDPFLSIRTERASYSLGLGYDRQLGNRWEWTGSISAWQADYSGIDGFDPGTTVGSTPEDKTGYVAATGFNHTVSARSSVGGEYTYGLTELDMGGDIDTHRLDFTFSTRVSRRISLGGRAGGYHSTRDATDETKSGAEGTLSINFNDDLTAGPVRVRFGFGILPSYGGAQEGTSTNTGAFVAVSGVRDWPINWGLDARYTERRPQFLSQSTLDTTTLSAKMEVGILQNLGFRIRLRHTDQSSPGQLDRSFYVFTAGPTWYPLGRTRIAGR